MTADKKAYLILEDGTRFDGYSFGEEAEISGEVVFNTNMAGFQETLTDSNYIGQIVVQTFPVVGVPGTNGEDNESDYAASGVVVREYCSNPSNFREDGTIDAFMRNRGIVGIYGIDTRKLTRKIRDNCGIKGIISSNPNAVISNEITPPPVAVGIKNSLRNLLDGYGYNGVVLPSGPGNPCDYPEQIEYIRTLISNKTPIFAVGLGHQMLALALGGEVEKLPHGHRGSNLPVRDLRNGNIYLTRQNHGYAVKTVPPSGEVILENVIDKSCEGIVYKNISAMSVQFEPSVNGGPRNTKYLIEEFLNWYQ